MQDANLCTLVCSYNLFIHTVAAWGLQSDCSLDQSTQPERVEEAARWKFGTIASDGLPLKRRRGFWGMAEARRDRRVGSWQPCKENRSLFPQEKRRLQRRWCRWSSRGKSLISWTLMSLKSTWRHSPRAAASSCSLTRCCWEGKKKLDWD